jgi:hypothetical protein
MNGWISTFFEGCTCAPRVRVLSEQDVRDLAREEIRKAKARGDPMQGDTLGMPPGWRPSAEKPYHSVDHGPLWDEVEKLRKERDSLAVRLAKADEEARYQAAAVVEEIQRRDTMRARLAELDSANTELAVANRVLCSKLAAAEKALDEVAVEWISKEYGSTGRLTAALKRMGRLA